MKKRMALILSVIVMMSSMTGCDVLDKLKGDESSATKSEETGSKNESATKSNASKDNKDDKDDKDEKSSSEFSPQDVSDETIKSIKTYGDYVVMYQCIINDYYDYYESKVKGTILWSEETFSDLKKARNEAYEEVKKTYQETWDVVMPVKDTMIEMLVKQRDTLRDTVDAMTAHLG